MSEPLFVASAGWLMCLEPTTGHVRWSQAIGEPGLQLSTWAPVEMASWGGKVVIGWDAHLFVLLADSGAYVFGVRLPPPIQQGEPLSLLPTEERIFVAGRQALAAMSWGGQAEWAVPHGRMRSKHTPTLHCGTQTRHGGASFTRLR